MTEEVPTRRNEVIEDLQNGAFSSVRLGPGAAQLGERRDATRGKPFSCLSGNHHPTRMRGRRDESIYSTSGRSGGTDATPTLSRARYVENCSLENDSFLHLSDTIGYLRQSFDVSSVSIHRYILDRFHCIIFRILAIDPIVERFDRLLFEQKKASDAWRQTFKGAVEFPSGVSYLKQYRKLIAFVHQRE